MKSPARFKALVTGEYAPLAGNVLLWAQVVGHIGPRQAASAGAANLCVLAAASLTMISTAAVVRRRRGSEPAVWRLTLRRAWFAEAMAIVAGIAAIAIFIVGYAMLGRSAIIMLIGLQAGGLPARYSGPLRAGFRSRRYYKLCRSWSGAGLMLPVLFMSPSMVSVSLALAAREWLALLLLWTARGKRKTPGAARQITNHPPQMAEFAAATANISQRRFVYHVGRSLLGLALGPAGAIVARTGRGFRLHGKMLGQSTTARWLVRSMAAGLCLAAIWTARFVPGPGALVASAAFLRVGCAALAAAVWMPFASVDRAEDLDEDLDD